jgi:serine/threonine protein kinase
MTLKPGTQLGPYEIVTAIGAGGMGEVYRARDPRVGRDVAIKLSSERFTDRFEREIKAGVGDVAADGKRFLLLAPAAENSTAQFNIILNWPALLKK